MPRLLHPVAGAFLLAAAALPRPGNAADAAPPLDPTATSGLLTTENPFDGHVPLLNREVPAPSFAFESAAGDRPAPDDGERRSLPAMYSADTATGHRGHAPAPME
jgi:hypothetical protein